ncbi:hypothetical protein K3G39_18415 [Pontibacter sp. HSC-14F20]|uniref:hypothetical protein n=1 Tax=Pontibacter sp. HSC-14F20 TaxID=2864136 RepID=UPI001C73BEC6|nr:hypothetical protein [Pontibacter sp. HSC-14F20]MBX0335213.1 hypothetical protein [Pontibacter sp. HSC-14F20]
MSKYNLNWQATDEQLLDALLLATGGEGGATLQDVLLMIDALDSDVLAMQDLEQGLEKLVSAGFVLVQKNKLALTEQFLARYEEATLNSAEETPESPLQKLLSQTPLTEAGIQQARNETLKKYKLKNYYQQYLEQFG